MKKDEPILIPPLPLWPDSAAHTPISTDPFGSYTGRPMDPDDKPIQDADDL